MLASAVAKVRAPLRLVSRMGHSHARSMWAWPTALIAQRGVAARAGQQRGQAAPAPGAPLCGDAAVQQVHGVVQGR